MRLILSLLLVLVTLALYNRISRAPYLNYDDKAYVYENFNVRSGLHWGTITWAFTTDAESNWHPITWLSHCLDVTLFGLNPAGPNYVNVLLHAANALFLFSTAGDRYWLYLAKPYRGCSFRPAPNQC